MRRLATTLALASLLIAPAAMAQGTGSQGTATQSSGTQGMTPQGGMSQSGTSQGGTMRSAGGQAGAASGAANQYQSEAAAKQACGSQTVVWVNTSGSKAWHVAGDRYFGHTKHGAYMCEQAAQQAGYHPAGKTARKGKTAAAR